MRSWRASGVWSAHLTIITYDSSPAPALHLAIGEAAACAVRTVTLPSAPSQR
jgi:hypothetical protein